MGKGVERLEEGHAAKISWVGTAITAMDIAHGIVLLTTRPQSTS